MLLAPDKRRVNAESLRQWGIALLGLPAIWCAVEGQDLARWGVLLGLAGQPLWVFSTLRARQMGMFLLSLAYTLVWARGAWIHWRHIWA